MDEKTAALRDIFVETTGEETVTEGQSESPGSLVDEPDDERVRETLRRVRETVGFETDLSVGAYERVVRGVFDDESDAEIAAALDVDEATVRRARLDCHLVREGDRDAPFSLDRLRRLVDDDVPLADRAETLGADEATVAHYSAVVAAELASRRVNHRFRDALTELLSDAPLSDQFATDAREDGLREATEDIETDVKL
ncbi:conditioned medium-induced protein 4 [Halobaculum sp. MBLA0147]|uniref:conditioned medium-induced protein 4 n=1 Tax=Halobaculum sp. MBLA0147 TaxID=3079934 RepID=UPI003526554C